MTKRVRRSRAAAPVVLAAAALIGAGATARAQVPGTYTTSWVGETYGKGYGLRVMAQWLRKVAL